MHSQVARKCLPCRTRNVTLDIALRGSIITRDITDYSFETVGNAIESLIAQEEQQYCKDAIQLIIHNFPCTCSLHKYRKVLTQISGICCIVMLLSTHPENCLQFEEDSSDYIRHDYDKIAVIQTRVN